MHSRGSFLPRHRLQRCVAVFLWKSVADVWSPCKESCENPLCCFQWTVLGPPGRCGLTAQRLVVGAHMFEPAPASTPHHETMVLTAVGQRKKHRTVRPLRAWVCILRQGKNSHIFSLIKESFIYSINRWPLPLVSLVTVLPDVRGGVCITTQGVCVRAGRRCGVSPWDRGWEEPCGDAAVLQTALSRYKSHPGSTEARLTARIGVCAVSLWTADGSVCLQHFWEATVIRGTSAESRLIKWLDIVAVIVTDEQLF